MKHMILNVPKGKLNPINLTRATRAIREPLEVDDTDEWRVLVKCEGCYPPDGFHISREHWAAQWAPFVREEQP